MGREQYTDPSAEAVARIEASVDELEVLVQDIKDTDLANIEDNIFTPLKYTPFTYGYANSGAPVGSFVTVLDITGEGYIESALAMLSDGAATMNMKITIDGVVVWDTSHYLPSAPNAVSGLVNKAEVMASGNSDVSTANYVLRLPFLDSTSGNIDRNATMTHTYLGTLPNTKVGNREVMLVSDKIGFDTSLKIELKQDTSSFMLGLFKGGLV